MKNAILLVLILFASSNVFATYNLGGHITYKAKSTYLYEITITVYTDARSIEADRPIINVDFGDGKQESAERISQKLVAELVHENVYVIQHEYDQAGKYLISLTEPNRTADIINLDNSVSQPFYLESLLVIDTKVCANSSPTFSIPPVFYASVNGNIIQSLNVYDENGDSIVYTLSTPQIDSVTKVNGYVHANGLQIIDGQLVWQPAKITGKYLIAIKIAEYKSGKLVGYVVKEWTTDVVSTDNSIILNSPCNNADNIVCKYDAREEKLVIFQIKIPGLTAENGRIEMFAPAIEFTENKPDFTISEDASGNITGLFKWQPKKQNIREQELNFVFRATKNGKPAIQNHQLVKIYVSGNETDPCTRSALAIGEETQPEFENFNVFPNPFTQSATINLYSAGAAKTCIVYNMQGQKVAEIVTENGVINIDGNFLRAGIYTFHISNSQKMLGSGKFVVQK